MPLNKASLIPLPQPLLPPLRDEDFLVDLLAELTELDRAQVRQRFEKETMDMGINVREALADWKLQPYVWHDRLADFYQQTDAFLFETLVWNRLSAKCQMRQWIGEYIRRDHAGPARILTFGDGLGIDSLYLSQAGHQVDYFEVSKKCVRFARAIGERMNTTLQVIDRKEGIQAAAYDYVVCLDVLEHVPEPQRLVSDLASYLKPGGRLISHAPFWYVQPSVVTHLAANRKYSGDMSRLYRPAGFRLIDGKFFWSPIVLELANATGMRDRIPIWKRVSLTAGGMLLSIGRYWNWPHQFVAGRMLTRVEAN